MALMARYPLEVANKVEQELSELNSIVSAFLSVIDLLTRNELELVLCS